MTSLVYWLQRGGHTQVRLIGPPESTVNWPGRRREEVGSEHIAHIRVIQVLPVADNWIDEDEETRLQTLGETCWWWWFPSVDSEWDRTGYLLLWWQISTPHPQRLIRSWFTQTFHWAFSGHASRRHFDQDGWSFAVPPFGCESNQNQIWEHVTWNRYLPRQQQW